MFYIGNKVPVSGMFLLLAMFVQFLEHFHSKFAKNANMSKTIFYPITFRTFKTLSTNLGKFVIFNTHIEFLKTIFLAIVALSGSFEYIR
jgi:hypothetical protein